LPSRLPLRKTDSFSLPRRTPRPDVLVLTGHRRLVARVCEYCVTPTQDDLVRTQMPHFKMDCRQLRVTYLFVRPDLRDCPHYACRLNKQVFVPAFFIQRGHLRGAHFGLQLTLFPNRGLTGIDLARGEKLFPPELSRRCKASDCDSRMNRPESGSSAGMCKGAFGKIRSRPSACAMRNAL
jgi:hypothetical protein